MKRASEYTPQKRIWPLLVLASAWLLCLQPAWAGNPLKGLLKGTAKAPVARKFSSQQVERILANRAQISRQQFPALSVTQRLYVYDADLPVQKILKWDVSRGPQVPYEKLPFWHKLSKEGKYNYFLAANNRASKHAVTVRLKAAEDIQKNLKELWNKRQTPTAELPEQTLLRAIKPQDRYILIGEEHDTPEVQDFLIRFLKTYQAQYSGRKIVLLTEFLPAGKEQAYIIQEKRTMDPDYGNFFVWAQAHGVRVKGMEPRYVFFQNAFAESDPAFKTAESSQDLWVLSESIRLRNNFWIEQIQKWREQYPDAVFILYAGAEHVAYNAPFSVANRLPAENTFVAHVFVQRSPDENPGYDYLDEIGGIRYPFYQQRVLSWNSPSLSRVAGFDMRVILPQRKAVPAKKK